MCCLCRGIQSGCNYTGLNSLRFLSNRPELSEEKSFSFKLRFRQHPLSGLTKGVVIYVIQLFIMITKQRLTGQYNIGWHYILTRSAAQPKLYYACKQVEFDKQSVGLAHEECSSLCPFSGTPSRSLSSSLTLSTGRHPKLIFHVDKSRRTAASVH